MASKLLPASLFRTQSLRMIMDFKELICACHNILESIHRPSSFTELQYGISLEKIWSELGGSLEQLANIMALVLLYEIGKPKAEENL